MSLVKIEILTWRCECQKQSQEDVSQMMCQSNGDGSAPEGQGQAGDWPPRSPK